MKELNREMFNSIRTIAIYGDTGTGKSCLAYTIISLFTDKKIYFLKHPKPELIEALGYSNLDSLEQMENIQDCVLFCDEPQLYLSLYEKRANRIISKVCSLARQLDITLIISSSDTRVFTKSNEAYFDLWLVKDLDYTMVKNGSRVKEVIKKNCLFEPEGFSLKVNEYLADSRKCRSINGKHIFIMPDYFTEAYSKPYAKCDNNCEENKKSEENADTSLHKKYLKYLKK